MNFYKHHLGDYDGATTHLSWDEDAAYTRLLRAYYRREKPIPDSDKYRLSRASSKAQRAAVDSVLTEFFELHADGWHNKRADEEIMAYQAQAETNRRIAHNRKGVRTVNESLARSSPEPKSKRTPNHKPEPRTKNQEPEAISQNQGTSTPSADAPDWLPREWKEYEQHRKEKRQALTAIARAACIAKLARWTAQGHDIAAVLRRSIDNGYTGLIDPNERGAKPVGVTAGNVAAAQEFVRQGREEDESEKPAS